MNRVFLTITLVALLPPAAHAEVISPTADETACIAGLPSAWPEPKKERVCQRKMATPAVTGGCAANGEACAVSDSVSFDAGETPEARSVGADLFRSGKVKMASCNWSRDSVYKDTGLCRCPEYDGSAESDECAESERVPDCGEGYELLSKTTANQDHEVYTNVAKPTEDGHEVWTRFYSSALGVLDEKATHVANTIRFLTRCRGIPRERILSLSDSRAVLVQGPLALDPTRPGRPGGCRWGNDGQQESWGRMFQRHIFKPGIGTAYYERKVSFNYRRTALCVKE